MFSLPLLPCTVGRCTQWLPQSLINCHTMVTSILNKLSYTRCTVGRRTQWSEKNGIKGESYNILIVYFVR